MRLEIFSQSCPSNETRQKLYEEAFGNSVGEFTVHLRLLKPGGALSATAGSRNIILGIAFIKFA